MGADVQAIDGLSAHANRHTVMDWLAHFSPEPDRAMLVHGEANVADGFAEFVRQRFNWEVNALATHETFEL
ncbi:MAG: hypothetical protein JSW48_11945 [Betaproteobacteria bacterium]|jgi:metallo-beta-lactamase family protein|nr:MAG: hypothetical protein JSW48_11945 [Betaproteobacteria bacterium]